MTWLLIAIFASAQGLVLVTVKDIPSEEACLALAAKPIPGLMTFACVDVTPNVRRQAPTL